MGWDGEAYGHLAGGLDGGQKVTVGDRNGALGQDHRTGERFDRYVQVSSDQA